MHSSLVDVVHGQLARSSWNLVATSWANMASGTDNFGVLGLREALEATRSPQRAEQLRTSPSVSSAPTTPDGERNRGERHPRQSSRSRSTRKTAGYTSRAMLRRRPASADVRCGGSRVRQAWRLGGTRLAPAFLWHGYMIAPARFEPTLRTRTPDTYPPPHDRDPPRSLPPLLAPGRFAGLRNSLPPEHHYRRAALRAPAATRAGPRPPGPAGGGRTVATPRFDRLGARMRERSSVPPGCRSAPRCLSPSHQPRHSRRLL